MTRSPRSRRTRAATHPHHWSYIAYGTAMPGWVAGGPNSSPGGVDAILLELINRGTPPAKCFHDGRDGTSYASNEGQIVAIATLVFVAGMLSAD